jgi:DNA (cytosine-5)-methyltransferase 1
VKYRRNMNELALFAGAGGGILGGKLLGWRTVCAVEIDAYCARRLMQRQNEGHLPPFPIWDDVRTFDGLPWSGVVDVIPSGFPCQRHSTIGNLHGSRHFDGWPDTIRIIKQVKPRTILLENVPGILVSYWGRVIADLAELGYCVRWGVFSCADADDNAPQVGKRVFAVATSGSNGLEEAKSRLAERQETWQSIMSSSTNRTAWSLRVPEPSIPCMVDGMADYMGEVSAIGNGQVPAVVKLAWEVLRP